MAKKQLVKGDVIKLDEMECPGESVEIRPAGKMKWADLILAQQLTTASEDAFQPGTVEKLIARNVLSWTFRDDDGEVIPVPRLVNGIVEGELDITILQVRGVLTAIIQVMGSQSPLAEKSSTPGAT